jgi:cytochrome c biogenesis protein
MPSDFVSNVTVVDHGRSVLTQDVRVNEYLGYDNVDFYQQDYGWAPHMVVRNPSGEVVSDTSIQMITEDKTASTGVLKVPSFNYTLPGQPKPTQLGARLVLYPDAQALPQLNPTSNALGVTYGPGTAAAHNPVVEVQLFVGDLGLDNGMSQDVFSLDTSGMQPYYAGATAFALPLNQTTTLQLPAANSGTANFTISVPELRQFSLFHVKKDSGVPLVYTAFILTMVGLLTKLYLRPFVERRRRRRAAALWPVEVGAAAIASPVAPRTAREEVLSR